MRMPKQGGRAGGISLALAASAALLSMLATFSSAAPANAAVAKLGYNTIQLIGAGDPEWNFQRAVNNGATWFRGGPGMQEDPTHQDAYVHSALNVGLNVIYVLPRPGTGAAKLPEGDLPVPIDTTPAQYEGICNAYVQAHSDVQAYEIMNEPNTYGGTQAHPVYIGGQPWSVQRYAQYAIHCEAGIRDARPNVPVLGASEDMGRTSFDHLNWQDWLYWFGYYTQNSAPDIIISSHIYPQGDELDSPEQAANSVLSDIAYSLIYADWDFGVHHSLWITEMGVRDDWLAQQLPGVTVNQVCAPSYKPEYLKQMFQMAGDNNTYDVPKVVIYRFTRAQHDDPSGFNNAGVYDSQDPPLHGYHDCGMSALASVAP